MEQKNIALIKYVIERYTNHGDRVVDCFAGTGTTLVACLETGRIGYGCENDPACFRCVIVQCQRFMFFILTVSHSAAHSRIVKSAERLSGRSRDQAPSRGARTMISYAENAPEFPAENFYRLQSIPFGILEDHIVHTASQAGASYLQERAVL